MRFRPVTAHPRRWRAGRRLPGARPVAFAALASLAVAAAAVLLAGCGSTPPAPAQPQGMRLNDADTTFLQSMSAELSQTRELLRLAEGKVADAELGTLVAAIDVTQQDELGTIEAWLDANPGPASPGDDDHHHPLAVGGSPDPRDVARLQSAAHGGSFDAALANVLLAHQQAASELARTELNEGRDTAVTGLALRVARSRGAQVGQLLQMLSRLPTPAPSG